MITATVDLRPKLLPVRDQGRRQSCLAFASSTAHEHQASPGEHLSVEYLFFHAVERTPGKNPCAGTTMLATAEALAQAGQPLETVWPYTPDQMTPWSPPTLSTAPLKTKMVPSKLGFADLILALDQGNPVVLGLVITDAFFRPDGHGLVPDRDPDPERGGHAVLAIGHGHAPNGLPAILIRNSWGAGWGVAGHAWLSDAYLARHLHETATLT